MKRTPAGATRIAGAALAAASMLLPPMARADACAGPSVLIHSALPVDPDPRLIVARVDVEWADPNLLYGRGVTARVVRVIHGDYDGELMILWADEGGCSDPFRNGRSGLIAGIPLRMEDGLLVVEALEINAGSDYRLPDGYRVPDPYLQLARQRDAARAAKREARLAAGEKEPRP